MSQEPKKFYKYTKYKDNEDRVLHGLIENSFWFSRLCDLNDPFEGDFGVKDFEDFLDGRIESGPDDTDEDRARLIADYRVKRRKGYLVYSVSKSPSIPLLWAHYADSHQGICLEVEIKEGEAAAKELDDKPPGSLLTNKVIEEVKYEDAPLFISKEKVKSPNVVLRKHTDWKYEQECRIVLQTPNEFPKRGYLHSKSKAMKYTAVILGIRFPADQIDAMVDFCQSNKLELKKAYQAHGRHRIEVRS